jgi:hypothetical protein
MQKIIFDLLFPIEKKGRKKGSKKVKILKNKNFRKNSKTHGFYLKKS